MRFINSKIIMKLGHADFYPNGGSKQPGCGLDFAGNNIHMKTLLLIYIMVFLLLICLFLLGTCSHSRSHQLFVETFLPKTFVSYNCKSYEELKNDKKCTVINEMVKMGTENGLMSNSGR